MNISDKPVWALFLDIDGVLSGPAKKKDFDLKGGELFPGSSDLSLFEKKIVWAKLFDKGAVGNLDRLIDRISQVAEVVIILSSSWRKGLSVEELKEQVFRDWNFSRYLIDKTPETDTDDRWAEIRSWLDVNGDPHRIQKFIILDDNIFNFPRTHFIEVQPDWLLTSENVEEAWAKFNDEDYAYRLPSKSAEPSETKL